MSLIITAVNSQYQLDFFLANLKQKVVRLLISEIIVVLRQVKVVKFLKYCIMNLKLNYLKLMLEKFFMLSYSTFYSKTSSKTHKSEKQHSVDQEIETEIKFFWLKKNYLLKKLNKLNSCLGGTEKRKNTHNLLGLQECIFWHHHLLFILKDYL